MLTEGMVVRFKESSHVATWLRDQTAVVENVNRTSACLKYIGRNGREAISWFYKSSLSTDILDPTPDEIDQKERLCK